ncbi:hypothetical protein PFISCL1PPCAC_4706, partial [Pristionchus fissidentatus]
ALPPFHILSLQTSLHHLFPQHYRFYRHRAIFRQFDMGRKQSKGQQFDVVRRLASAPAGASLPHLQAVEALGRPPNSRKDVPRFRSGAVLTGVLHGNCADSLLVRRILCGARRAEHKVHVHSCVVLVRAGNDDHSRVSSTATSCLPVQNSRVNVRPHRRAHASPARAD